MKDIYQSLVEHANDAIIIATKEGSITYLNPKTEEMFGYTRDELIGKSVTMLIPQEKRDEEQEILEGIRVKKEKGTIGSIKEGKGITKNGQTIYVEVSYFGFQRNEDYSIGGIIRDISEKKLIDEKLRISEERARALLNAPIDTAVLVNDKGIIVDCNSAFMKRFNKDKDVLVGSSAFDLLEPEVAKKRRNAIKKVVLEGKPLHLEDQHQERWFQHSIYPILDNQGKVIQLAVVSHDYTKMKQAELELTGNRDRLRLLASQLTEAEEEARRYFANFLHDKIGQTFFILKIRLEMHQKSLEGSNNFNDIHEAIKLLRKLMEDTRTLSYEMSPAILQELGLEAALKWLTEKTNKDYDIVVDFKSDKQPIQLDEIVSTTLFRAVSELLTNIVKHAKAQHATITIRREDNSITICVEDDGIGFDISKLNTFPSEEKGFGIFNIQERLNYLGGELKIASSGDQGTKITLRAPLKI